MLLLLLLLGALNQSVLPINLLRTRQVLTVYHKGTVVSGVPLMLSVLRCGNSYKFIGRDQEACWAHHGYCYEFEVRLEAFRACELVVAGINAGELPAGEARCSYGSAVVGRQWADRNVNVDRSWPKLSIIKTVTCSRGRRAPKIRQRVDTASSNSTQTNFASCLQVVSILQQHNRRYRHEHKGDTFMSGRVGPVDTSRTKKVKLGPSSWY